MKNGGNGVKLVQPLNLFKSGNSCNFPLSADASLQGVNDEHDDFPLVITNVTGGQVKINDVVEEEHQEGYYKTVSTDTDDLVSFVKFIYCNHLHVHEAL